MGAQQAGDERLGRVLRDAVEGRGRPATASGPGAGIGARTFVAAVERRAPERLRPSGERPRVGAIVVAAVIGAVAAAALALWPAITSHRAHAPRPAPATTTAAPARHPGTVAARMSFLRPFAGNTDTSVGGEQQ